MTLCSSGLAFNGLKAPMKDLEVAQQDITWTPPPVIFYLNSFVDVQMSRNLNRVVLMVPSLVSHDVPCFQSKTNDFKSLSYFYALGFEIF